MKIIENKREKNLQIFIVEAEQKDLQKAFNETFSRLSGNVTVKGFRPGKAPKYLVIAQLGENKITEETFSTVLEFTYSELLKTEKFSPVDYPKVDVKKYTLDYSDPEKVKGELQYEAKVEVMPDAKLGDFRKIKLSKKDKISVEPKEVDNVLEYLARQKAQFKSVASPAKIGNRVEINFEGEVDGKKLPEMKSTNHPIILGDKTMIPGFEDQIVGMKVGDEKEFDITFPSDYSKTDLRGKKAHFKVDLVLVQEIILPEFDDKMAKDFGHKTFAELKSAITKNIEEEKNHDRIHKEEEEIVNQLSKLTKVELSDVLVERELDRMMEDAKKRVEQYKVPFTQYLGNLKKTEEEFRESMREQASKAVIIGFALREVIKELNISSDGPEAGQQAMEELFKIAYKNSGMGNYKPHHHA